MDERKIEEISNIWEVICLTGSIPWYTDFATDEDREKYLADTYAGATLKELLDIGIDPFK